MFETSKGVSIIILTLSVIVFVIIGAFVYQQFFIG